MMSAELRHANASQVTPELWVGVTWSLEARRWLTVSSMNSRVPESLPLSTPDWSGTTRLGSPR